MRRISTRSLRLGALAALALLAGSAQAFPLSGAFLQHMRPQRIETFGFGVVGAGDCVLVRQEIVDASNRVHVRMVKVCN